MKLRKIRTGLLGISAIVYRAHVVLVHTALFYVLTGDFKLSIGTSVGLGIINIGLYYNYHYWFARCFKLGKENKGDLEERLDGDIKSPNSYNI